MNKIKKIFLVVYLFFKETIIAIYNLLSNACCCEDSLETKVKNTATAIVDNIETGFNAAKKTVQDAAEKTQKGVQNVLENIQKSVETGVAQVKEFPHKAASTLETAAHDTGEQLKQFGKDVEDFFNPNPNPNPNPKKT